MSNGLNNMLSPSVYSTPIAVCESDGSTVANGYCRHAMMCGGTCSAYSILNRDAHTFTPLQVVCDPGWLAPDCATRCTNVDSNGACVVQVQTLVTVDSPVSGLSDAYSPNGYWCQVLKQYQVAEKITGGSSGAQFFVTLSARSYEYLIDITVPDGQITALVGQSVCPSIAMQADGSGSMYMLVANTDSSIATLQILTASESSCAAPLPCCTNEYSLTIPAFRSVSWRVPSACAQLRITVKVNQGNSLQLCRVISASTAASEANAAVTAPLTANVQHNLIVTGNEVLAQLADNNQQLASAMFQLQAAAVRSVAVGIDQSDAIDQMVADILAIQATTINDTYLTTLSNPFNSDAEWQSIVARINQLHADTVAGTVTVANSSYTLSGLSRVFSELANETAANTAAMQLTINVLHNQTVATNAQLNQTIYDMQRANDRFSVALELLLASVQADSSGSSLSSTTLGLLITGSVLGSLAGLSLLVWLALQFSKKLRTGRARRSRREVDEEENSGESEEGEDDETSGEEDEEGEDEEEESEDEEEEEEEEASTSSTAQAALAIARSQRHYRRQPR
jgi:hypothetical protein